MNLKLFLCSAVLYLTCLSSCIQSRTVSQEKEDQLKTVYESEALEVVQLSDQLFQHISYLETQSFGKVACNGVVYFSENEAIIFDTPVDKKSSNELLKWVGEKKVQGVVITHFHVDCLGGLDRFHSAGVPSFATEKTIALAKTEEVEVLPQVGFEIDYTFEVGGEQVEAKFYGQGHTEDNIVGYFPGEQALFGGCLIKSLDAPKGNLADANVSEWPHTVENIKTSFPDIELVVPGHGKSGGGELLDYTIDLFSKH